MQLEREAEPLRGAITARQLEEQEARLQAEQYRQMLADAQVDVEQLAARLPSDCKPEELGRETQRLNREIAALGAVNLAALDELGHARERKEFLDAQLDDLEQAARTLEDAIHKIDAETREQLRLTFDQVNTHFGRVFPELFGGGAARLIMTGDEILDAGVQVMAQPPGKRNSTIHLLSGGEKALVAIALVFGIFHLTRRHFAFSTRWTLHWMTPTPSVLPSLWKPCRERRSSCSSHTIRLRWKWQNSWWASRCRSKVFPAWLQWTWTRRRNWQKLQPKHAGRTRSSWCGGLSAHPTTR